jgi:hypothetical protein
MKNQIIAQVLGSDRNIYIIIEDGALVSVNYSQGLGDIDLHFLQTHNEGITSFVKNKLFENLYSVDFFFPSPNWDEQVKIIDDAIWDLLKEENERAELIETIEKLEKQLVELKKML